MPGKKAVLGVIDRVNKAVASTACYLVPLLGFLVMFELVMRYVFNRPTVWVHDISQFLFGAIYILGAGYTLSLQKHVNMDMLWLRFPERGRAVADALTGVLVIVFLGVLVWQSAMMAWESILFRETLMQSVFEPPLYPIKTIFFLGCLLFLLQALAQFVRNIITAFSKPEESEN